MSWWVTELRLAGLMRKVRRRVLPNLQHLPRSRLRRCRACGHYTLVLAIGADEEFHVCLRCRANLRYELLAEYLRRSFADLSAMDVLELDYDSPLRAILSRARNYTRSFYRAEVAPGTRRQDGAVCEDITRLTFPDESLDLIVSSDVLEHVPDAQAAFREAERVLRPGGVHVFTVPPRGRTRRRAAVEGGQVVHLVQPPEYHQDPLDAAGILAFWDYGPDLPAFFATDRLRIRAASEPEGRSGRFVWEARKS